MTTLIWLAGSSLIWGAILFCAVFALQSRFVLSGAERQWMWRGAGLLLILPWLAVPVIDVAAPGLALSIAPAVEPAATSATVALAEAALTSMPTEPSSMAPLLDEGAPLVLPWVQILAGVLIAGWLARFGLAQAAAVRLRRLLDASAPAPVGPSRDALGAWSRRLRLRRMPDLRVTAAEVSPFSSGALRPVICLHAGIDRKLRPEALGLVVGHECIHVARRDGWWRPVERAIADVLWFNPFAWAMRRELDLARELACDEAVVAASDARRAYARTLRDVAGIVAGVDASAPAASMSLAGSGRLLALRMKRTLAAARTPGGAAVVAAIVLAAAAAPMAVAQALLIEAVQPDPPPAPAPPAPPVAVIDAVPAVPAIAAVPPVPAPAPRPDPSPVLAPVRAPATAPHPVPAPDLAPDPAPVPAPVPEPVPGPVRAFAPAPPSAVAVPQPPLPPAVIRAERGEPLVLPFPARVVDTRDRTGKGRGLEVTLVQSEDSDNMQGCTAMLAGMKSLNVKDGDVLAKGSPVGIVGDSPNMAISCQSMGGARIETRAGGAPRAFAFAPMAVAPTPPPAMWVAPGVGVMIAPEAGAAFAPAQPLEPIRLTVAPPKKLDGAHAVLGLGARRTSGFGLVTQDGRSAFHEGIDLAARLGAPVHSPGAGTVTFAGDKGRYGSAIEISLGDGHSVRFAHLGEIRVREGESVPAGHVIGTIGDDEYTTGPHLHLEYRYKERAYDPEKVEGLVLTRPG